MTGWAVLCATLVVAGCGGSSTAPSADVSGAWDFTFSVFDQRACPGTFGPVQGCAGSGQLRFRTTRPLDVTHSFRASCQSCVAAADYGVFEQPLRTARIAGDVLEFTLAACRFTATLPDAPARTIGGAATCRPAAADAEISGTWTMSRP